jgi:4-hydroxybenzoate polyprenyltransferase
LVKYYGIHYYYPRLRRILGEKLVAYLRLCRPFTGLAPLLAGIFLTITPVETVTFESIKVGVYVGITLMLAQFTGQIINQYMDSELDKLIPSKKDRPIPSGKVSREEALGISYLLAIACIGRAFTVNINFGVLTLLMLFFAVFYSLPPLTPRRNAFISLTWMSFSRGFIPPIACFSVYGSIYEALPYSLLSFLWCLGWQCTKDIPDVEADRRYGVKTLANTYGVKWMKIYTAILTIMFFTTAFLLGKYIYFILFPLAVYGLGYYEVKAGVTENTRGWTVFYIGLGLTFLLALVDFKL